MARGQGQIGEAARGGVSLRGQVKADHTELAENACSITTLAPANTRLLPNESAVAFSDHCTSTPRVSMSKAIESLANTCPTPAAYATLALVLAVCGWFTADNRLLANAGLVVCGLVAALV